MNMMNLILALCAAILTTLLVYVWKDDQNSAKNEPKALQAEINKLYSKNKALESKLALHQKSMEDKSKGINTPSPYNGTFQGQAEYKADTNTISQNNAQIERIQDKLENTDADPNGLSSSALDAVNSGNTGKSENMGNLISDKKRKKRAFEVTNSKVYATIQFIDVNEEPEIILASLAPNVSISTGASLSIRRGSEVTGKLKIISIDSYPDTGEVAKMERVDTGVILDDSVAVGDELILSPLWN